MVTKSEKIVSLNKTITANLRLTAAGFFLNMSIWRKIVLTKEATVFKLFIQRLN